MFIVNVEAAIYRGDRWLVIERGGKEAHAGGTLAFPGGKAEPDEMGEGILERTAARETAEEVGLRLDGPLRYVHSSSFVTDKGQPVINIVLMGESLEGEPYAASPDEVASLGWMTADEVLRHSKTPSWTRDNVSRAERLRRSLNIRE